MKLLEEAIAKNPNDLQARALLAMTYAWTKRSGRALDEARAAVELDPNSSFGHTAVGYSHWYRGSLDEADASLRQGIALYKGSPGPNPSEWLTYVLRDRNDMDGAKAVADASLHREPNDRYVLDLRNMIAQSEDDWRTARSLASRRFRIERTPLTFMTWVNDSILPLRITGTTLFVFLFVSGFGISAVNGHLRLQLQWAMWTISFVMLLWIWLTELANLIWERRSLKTSRLVWSTLVFVLMALPSLLIYLGQRR